MDSDLQHPPELIPTLLEHFEQGYDVVWTVRADTPKTSRFRRVTSRLFYRSSTGSASRDARELGRLPTHLATRGGGLSDRRSANETSSYGDSSPGSAFPALASLSPCAERAAGRSKYSLSRMVRFAMDGIVSFSKARCRLRSTPASSSHSADWLSASVIVVEFFVSGDFPPGWATLAILVIVFSGVQLIFLGIVGAYIGAIFDEVKARPHYIVQERVNFHRREHPDRPGRDRAGASQLR